MRKVIGILILQLVVVSGLIFAQGVNSSIVGTVTDTSGGPVPGANITVTNTQTGIAVKATTSRGGTYSVPELIVGDYAVSASKQGFETQTKSGIVVLSSSTVRVDLVLKVGSVTQHVTVVGQAPLVQTDSTNISTSITTNQLENLPTDLQTIDTFIGLADGVQSLNGDASNPPIGGSTHWGSVNFTLNGVGANQPGNSGGVDVQGVGLLVLPPPSSLKELKIQSDNMSAKYKGKANVNMVIKNGTNQFHGEAYEYVQNKILNANSFVNNAKGLERPAQHLNQFGFNVGGPIKRNKAFFFFDYNGYRNQDASTVRHIYPSMAMRTGDFSAMCTANKGTFNASGVCSVAKEQLYDPSTGNPFPGNIIPENMITSQSKALLKYLPAVDPSSTGLSGGTDNYVGAIPKTQDANSYDVRIDYNLSDKDRLFGVWAQRVANPWNSTVATYTPNYGQGLYDYKNYTLSASETHTFSANTINMLRLAWGDFIQHFGGQNGDFTLNSLFSSAPVSEYHGLPLVAVSGYTNLFHDVGTAHPTPQWDVEVSDDFTHIRGRHTIEAGIDETGYKIFSRHPPGNSTGTFSFDGRWTGRENWPGGSPSNGNSFADFLLGLPYNDATPGIGVYAKMIYSRQWGLYVQDTWQVKPNLTINYGLRYEYQTPWLYRRQEVTTFDMASNTIVLPQNSDMPMLTEGMDPALFNTYNALNLYTTTQSLGEPLQYVQPDKNNFAPRFGFAWRPFGGTRTVFRGGYGVYYNLQPAFVGSRNEAYNPPWILGITEPFATKLPSHATLTKQNESFAPDLTFTNPYPSVNNKTVVSPNPVVIFFQHDFKNAVIQEWNATLEHQFGTNWVARASYVGSQAHHLPYNGDPIDVPLTQTPNATAQEQNPLQPWSGVTSFRSAGKQNFNQLQLGVQHRLASGFSFDANYQYTRSLDNIPNGGGPLNWHFGNLDYGNTAFLRRHYLTFYYVYQLPFGRGQHWLSSAHGIEDALVGGWQVSGITHYATGLPHSVNFCQTGVKGVTGWLPGGCNGRADIASVGQIYSGQQSGHDIISGVQWFNTAAFAPPAEWTWGNSDRDMVWGPGYISWDMSAMKTFHMTERLRLQFRSDFLDAFNHMNLADPNWNIPDLRDGGSNIATSGKITAGGDYRRIQFALRLMF
jgi:Carboxypeptidase regulatory-like domain